ncbi:MULTISPECIES: SCO family protein [Kordiimonas]|jgi:protein SCO1/2|uniref:SCO family protein n=1 Tax=Kordiimonas TaxID=288021 RepID=UPI00257DA170|nr:SCO family protein [Kordiimonas sp. UBA4487]
MKVIRIVAWLAVAIVGIFILVNRYQSMQDTNSGPGGPFVLTSHTGETVSNNDFKGRYMLIYFGYSFCPDVCPIELGKMSAAMTMLEGEGYDISPLQPIFISVDPERDTVEALADYVTDFHPSLVALTGSPEEIAAVAKEYRVYYKKREQEGLDSYLMDHQSVIFVMDPDGKYVRLFSSRNTPADIADALKPVLLKAN